MKQIIIFLGLILSISTAQAGLFEYAIGENTHINSKSDESADAVEILQYNDSQIYRQSSPVRYTNTRTFLDSRNYSSYRDYNFDDSLYGVEQEMDYLLDVAGQLRRDINDLKNITSTSYRNLKRQLERDLDDVQERINFLSDRKRELLRDTGYYDSIRYSNRNDSYNRNYSRFESQRIRNIYDRYDYSYDDYRYGYYEFDESTGYFRRIPDWVNPNLKEVKTNGRIYIK